MNIRSDLRLYQKMNEDEVANGKMNEDESLNGQVNEDEAANDFVPRPYQVELEEIAAKRNTIIHLPTGSGKTFIAVRLIARFSHALRKPWGEGGKRTFFLVNNVPLVNQQKKVINSLCPVDGVAGYSGEDNVDFWNKNKWDMELSIHQVIVMTCQILCDMLTHQYIKIENINLMIFDECHHAVEDHPMRMIMKHFENCPPKEQPRVVGLTATLLNANPGTNSNILDSIQSLETTFHATVATINELGQVLKYSTNPNELVIYYKYYEVKNEGAVKALAKLNNLMKFVQEYKLPKVDKSALAFNLKPNQQDISTDPKKIIKAVLNMVVAMIQNIKELGLYGGVISIISYIILLERLKRSSLTPKHSILYSVAITHAAYARGILEEAMRGAHGYDKIVKHSSEQIVKLLNILKEYNPKYYENPTALLKVNKKKKPLSALIFVKQRITAKILYNLLKEVIQVNPEEFGFINHDYLIGFNTNPLKMSREDYFIKKQSTTALLKFSNEELNLLFTTSVVEEGIDIKQCLLVMRFDPPLEYRSYVQSKGRARSSDASYILLINEENKVNFLKKYRGYLSTEKYIQDTLIGNTEYRSEPTNSTIQKNLYEDEDIPPYINKYGGRLSAVQAISLISRYCSMLPHDSFTIITPMWISEKVKNEKNHSMLVVTIVMPISCPIKEHIRGDPYVNLKTAKRSAALKACKLLHEIGELDKYTMLPKNYGKVNFNEEEIKQCFPNWPWDKKEDPQLIAGLKKTKRKYPLYFPSYLNGSNDWKDGKKTFYLHIIDMKPKFNKSMESREAALFEFIERNEGYGFLTSQPLPALCDFPMFLTIGEVYTSLLPNTSIIIDKHKFDSIKRFHLYLYEQVLDISKKFLVFDGTENCLYTVPVKKNKTSYTIDYDIINNIQEIKPVNEPPFEERKNTQVTRESYLHAVVTPWYRSTIRPDRYVVSNVLEYLTPKSQFCAESYETYEQYYEERYNLQIIGSKDQPLLEVRDINSKLNCLLPRAATFNQLSDRQKKQLSVMQGDDKPRGFTEVFIPEFCIKYLYPGVLWYKATVLPSIVHRITMLLIADELRREIAKDTSIGITGIDGKWEPLDIDDYIAMKSLLAQIEPPRESSHNTSLPQEENSKCPTKIVTMKEAVYQLQKQKISNEYPWDKTMEPLDIERNVMTVTLMDIECYDKFVTGPLHGTLDGLDLGVKSTNTVADRPAILAPPLQYKDKIDLLSRKPTAQGPELKHILAALTTIKCHDTFDLERVETLGDSFLKFAATLYLFHKFPKLNEGQLTNIKGRLIGNRNLFYAGERINLGGRMKIEQFSPRKDFMVPGFFCPMDLQKFIEEKQIRPTFLMGIEIDREVKLSGQLTTQSWEKILERYNSDSGEVEHEPIDDIQTPMQNYVRTQVVPDKSIADCVEAMIGTYLLSCGITGAVKVLEWLRVLPKEDNFEEYLHRSTPTVVSLKQASKAEVDFLMNQCQSSVEKIIGYKFKDPSFLLEALSHSSYIRNRLTRSYQRLEFLGDAILDFLITSYIFENHKNLKPGDLTDLRSALVNNVTFASYVVRLGLHKFLCSQVNPILDKAIMMFAEHQEQRNHNIIEDVLHLIDEDDCQISEYIEVPKVLSDIFEALAGAIFLDSNGDLSVVWRVFYKIMHREIHQFSDNIPKQPVRILHEYIHASPHFGESKLTNTTIRKVMIPVTICKDGVMTTVHGFGNNKFQAKRAAAKLALKILSV